MDAVTVAAAALVVTSPLSSTSAASAALAVVIEESQQAAMQALLQERERLAMTVADRDSYLAQRHYVVSRQMLLPERPMTWETAFNQRHNELIDAHHAMRGAARAIRDGNADEALYVLEDIVGNDTEESSEADEERSAADAETTAGEEEEEEEDVEADA